MQKSWFQIHLFTALLMTLAAGGVIWLNTISSITPPIEEYLSYGMQCNARGWPLAYRHHMSGWSTAREIDEILVQPVWNIRNLIVDIAAGLAVVLAVAVLSERALRRRLR